MAKLFQWVHNGTNDSYQINSHFDKLFSDIEQTNTNTNMKHKTYFRKKIVFINSIVLK